jgi:lipoprotein-anchoring transpeptidase ErfK/SrfK
MTTRRPLTWAIAVAAGIVAAAIVGVLVLSWATSSSATSATQPLRLPPSPASGLRVPAAVPLRASTTLSYWVSVRRAVVARSRPSSRAGVVARLATTTPEGTTSIVLVLGRFLDKTGRLWLHVRLPVLPNDRTGWVPRSALGVYGAVHTRLVVDVERLTATLLRDGVVIFRAPIGVGTRQWPTPKGNFYIRDLSTRYRSPFYGPIAFGTSARSTVLTDWPGGGFVGIHGTDEPDLVPGRVSHGCIRLRNPDILELGRLMEIGTPVTIR